MIWRAQVKLKKCWKIERVKDFCKKNSRAFEYAFLIDALKEEQAQGITIDSARVFFKNGRRNYIFFDSELKF